MGVSGDDTDPLLCHSVLLSFGFNCSGSLVAANGALLRVATSIPASHNAGTPALPKQFLVASADDSNARVQQSRDT
jgi:hypothetical protein